MRSRWFWVETLKLQKYSNRHWQCQRFSNERFSSEIFSSEKFSSERFSSEGMISSTMTWQSLGSSETGLFPLLPALLSFSLNKWPQNDSKFTFCTCVHACVHAYITCVYYACIIYVLGTVTLTHKDRESDRDVDKPMNTVNTSHPLQPTSTGESWLVSNCLNRSMNCM